MAILILINQNKYYKITKKEPITIDLLADFLRDDVGNSAKSFIAWFESNHDFGSSNATCYLVDEGFVTFTPEWEPDFDECVAKGHYFQIRFDLLIQLLYQWEIVYKQKPLYITITINDNSVEVIGSK